MKDAPARVYVLTHTRDPEKMCAAAAKISTTPGSCTEIYNSIVDYNEAGRLVSKVVKFGHVSTIEHVNLTIAFENVSAFIEQFMIESRLAAFTIKSRRYVDFRNMGCYIPSFRFDESVPQEDQDSIMGTYINHMEYLFGEYEFFQESGIPVEDARFILPYCYRSNFYCTVNVREFVHIVYAMVYGRGKRFPELRQIGETLLEEGKRLFPSIFENIETIEGGRDDKEFRLREILEGINLNKQESDEPVEIITHTKAPEKLAAAAAIVNHTLCPIKKAEDLVDSNPELVDKVLDIVCEDKRKRELEQITFMFRINNLSLAGLTHLSRHRMQSLIVPSFTEFGISKKYLIPASIAENPELLKRYHAVWDKHKNIIKKFRDGGVVEEDLVYMYLSGNLVDVLTTMNGRELFHFFRLRTCNRAQWEIRAIALNMLGKLKKIAPKIFTKAGPSCYSKGQCTEGKAACGQAEEKRKEISSL